RHMRHLIFSEGVKHRGQEERIALGLAMQARSETWKLELRMVEALEQRLGIGHLQPRERHVPRVRLAPQTADQPLPPFVRVALLVAVGAREEQRPARRLAGEEVHEL